MYGRWEGVKGEQGKSNTCMIDGEDFIRRALNGFPVLPSAPPALINEQIVGKCELIIVKLILIIII